MNAPIEIRAAGPVVQVRYPERIVELVAVPYDTPATVDVAGRAVSEEVAPGAFDGIERRAGRVKAFLGHPDPDTSDQRQARSVGKVVAFHPSRGEGLVAEIHIGRGVTGTGVDRDQVLDDAADGILDASIGFGVLPGDSHWSEGRSRRRIVKAFLDHIALVTDPAYVTANVLAVRRHAAAGERIATPNLDRVRDWLLEERYGQI
jgi:phage head maturation protease